MATKEPLSAPKARKSKRDRSGDRPWWGAPQVLLAVFALVLGGIYALSARPVPSIGPAPGPLLGEDGEAALRMVEVRYLVVDQEGLERPGFADVPMTELAAQDPTELLNASLAALRADLLSQGAWPVVVPDPKGYVLLLDRRRVAVVDLSSGAAPGAGPARPLTSVAVELGAVRSLIATALIAVDAAEVRITVDGVQAESLWGNVALPQR